MHIRAHRILSPYDEQLRLGRVLRARPSHKSHCILPAHIASRAANALIQPGRAKSMEEAAIHAVHAERSHIPVEAVGHNAL
ncbi:hypothetical protein D3C77_451360 [compost metagenome]